MSSLADTWDELFEAAPTALETELMGNLARLVDPDDTTFILCALVVRFLNQSLLLDPGSPVNIAGRLNGTLTGLEARSRQLDKQFKRLNEACATMDFWVSSLQEIVREAGSIAKQRKIPPPVLALDPHTGSPLWKHTLAPNALWSFGLLALAGGVVGTMAGMGLTLILI